MFLAEMVSKIAIIAMNMNPIHSACSSRLMALLVASAKVSVFRTQLQRNQRSASTNDTPPQITRTAILPSCELKVAP